MPITKQYLGFIEYPKVVKKSRRSNKVSKGSKNKKLKKTVRKSRRPSSKQRKSRRLNRRPKSRSDSIKSCGKGQILRKGYKTKKGVKVSPTCITDLGNLGKSIQNIPVLRKGLLSRFGYHAHLDKEKRHKALKKAVKEYSAGNVVKKLNAIYVLSKNSNPSLAKIYNSDKKWVQDKYETTRSKSKKKSRRN